MSCQSALKETVRSPSTTAGASPKRAAACRAASGMVVAICSTMTFLLCKCVIMCGFVLRIRLVAPDATIYRVSATKRKACIGRNARVSATNPLSFEGRIVLVTGGGRGIGRAIVERFAGAGAHMITCGRNLPEPAPPAEFHICDVRQIDQIKAMMAAIGERHGRLDVLINNAGGSPPADAATVSPRFSEAIVGLNLMAPLHLSQACYALMQEAGGSIINIASVSAVRPSPGTAAYAAAKAGLLGLTRSLAQEWAPKIRVNAIIVGLIDTEQSELTYGSDAAQAALAASLPIKRLGRGADVADAALFLASPLASYVNGAELAVDGGGERPPFLAIVKSHSAPSL